MFPKTVFGNSLTTKHCIENLIKPLLIYLLYARADREGEWLLHLAAVKSMFPCFYAAVHHYYTWYGLWYLHNMEKLPQEVLLKFMKGKHAMRHQKSYWNSIWLDIYINKTFMLYRKDPGDIFGVTLKPGLWWNVLPRNISVSLSELPLLVIGFIINRANEWVCILLFC